MKNLPVPTSMNQNRQQVKLRKSDSRKKTRYDINQIAFSGQTSQVMNNLHDLIQEFPKFPSLLSGRLRHLKVEPHYREPTSRLWLTPQPYRKTSKIRLTGNWIEKAGFLTHERIRVIPMHRMLIIVPETIENDQE